MKSLKTVKVLKPFIMGGKRFMRFARANSNWILALLSILGLLGTAVTCVDATIKAVKVCEEKQVKGKKEIIKTVWKLYMPAVGCILVTVSTIATNAHNNAKRLATVTGLWAASQADIKAIKEKAKEMIGESKAKKLDEAVAAEKIRSNPPSEAVISETGHGNILFLMELTGQYFRANPDYIDAQLAKFNLAMSETVDGVLEVNDLTERFNLPNCKLGRALWDHYDMVEHGYKEVVAHIPPGQWVEINGQREVAFLVKCDPDPTLPF